MTQITVFRCCFIKTNISFGYIVRIPVCITIIIIRDHKHIRFGSSIIGSRRSEEKRIICRCQAIEETITLITLNSNHLIRKRNSCSSTFCIDHIIVGDYVRS